MEIWFSCYKNYIITWNDYCGWKTPKVLQIITGFVPFTTDYPVQFLTIEHIENWPNRNRIVQLPDICPVQQGLQQKKLAKKQQNIWKCSFYVLTVLPRRGLRKLISCFILIWKFNNCNHVVQIFSILRIY